jgi:hypothetical protein
MPSPNVWGAINGREVPFSSEHLKIYGITNQDATTRTEQGLERIRTVPATFIAAQI